ncbi:MAG: DNA-processing protein DprA [Clostridia bacterium]|nr:DNA-processing protein DprA [Clostridia bacterium]
MGHTDDAYAAMLLTMALSPNKEEYARPLSTAEFRRFEAAARESQFHGVGKLLDMDISGLMIYLGLTEEEAYRAFTLMHRGVQLSYALEGFAVEGIEVITQYDPEYPERLRRKLADAAPPAFYRCGNAALLSAPAVGITGISGVRTTPEARQTIETLVRGAIERGYGIITGGEPGVSRMAANLVARLGGSLVDILGGGMREHLKDEGIAQLVGEGRGLVLSLEHPDAMFTVSHAIARNRLLFSLSDAAFIFNTDGRRGEAEALQNRTCDWVYAWEDFAANRPLIARGAVPFGVLTDAELAEISRHWASSRSQQMNMFDLL